MREKERVRHRQTCMCVCFPSSVHLKCLETVANAVLESCQAHTRAADHRGLGGRVSLAHRWDNVNFHKDENCEKFGIHQIYLNS